MMQSIKQCMRHASVFVSGPSANRNHHHANQVYKMRCAPCLCDAVVNAPIVFTDTLHAE